MKKQRSHIQPPHTLLHCSTTEKKGNKIVTLLLAAPFFPPLLSSSSPLPCEIKFPCGSCICCTARWFIRDAKSMQKQSLLHPFPACQPGSCWLFIKGAAQVRRMHLDALIDCLLPCGDSSWMDWTVGGQRGREKKALTPSLPLSDTLLHCWPVSFLPTIPTHMHTQTSDTLWT